MKYVIRSLPPCQLLISQKIVNVFVYETGHDEKDLVKCQKVDNLALNCAEWEDIKLFNNLLAVCSDQLGTGFTIKQCEMCIAFR